MEQKDLRTETSSRKLIELATSFLFLLLTNRVITSNPRYQNTASSNFLSRMISGAIKLKRFKSSVNKSSRIQDHDR